MDDAAQSDKAEQDSIHWIGPSIVVAVFLWMTFISWQRWPDLVVDYGRELYVPWQMTEGQTLYQDLAYFNGPLSPYINATLFRLFGVSMMTLVWANLALTAVITVMIYHLLSKVTNQAISTVGCIAFLVAFAFSQQEDYGNYNFICPYSHEATHGFFFALLAVWLMQAERLPIYLRAILAGSAVGCTFICKPEFFVAASAAVGGMWFVSWRCSKRSGADDVRRSFDPGSLVLIFTGLALPLCAAVLILTQSIGVEAAVDGTLGSWKWILSSDVTQHRFYRELQGTNRPLLNLWKCLLAFVSVVAVLCAACIFQNINHGKGGWRWLIFVVMVAVGSHYLLGAQPVPTLIVPRMLTILMAVFSLWLLFQFFMIRKARVSTDELVVLTGLAMLSLFLLSKLFLNPRLIHYGFALALPATLTFILIAFELVPRFAFPDRRQVRLYYLIVGTLLLADVGLFWRTSQHYFRMRSLEITTQADTIYGFDSGMFAQRDLLVKEFIDERADIIRENQTLACLPEGVTINYLLRSRNPTPYFNLMPIELQLFGTEKITDSYKANPPDFILLVHKNMPEYGKTKFGDPEYAGELMDWVKENYDQVKQYGAKPFTSKRAGMALLKRRSSRLELTIAGPVR